MRFLGLIIFFTSISLSGFSQDLIIKKDSSKIYCKITAVDSLTIHYKLPTISNECAIAQANVLTFYKKGPIIDPRKTKTGTDTVYADNIFNAKKRKRGIYKSHFEFINNIPSVTDSFYSVYRGPSAVFKTVLTYDLAFYNKPYYANRKNQVEMYDSPYGFCNGDTVFVRAAYSYGYCPLEYIGRYSYYTEQEHDPNLFPLRSVYTGPVNYIHTIIIDENGNLIDADPYHLKKILKKKCPELYKQYKDEGWSVQKISVKEYVKKLDQYLSKNQSN